MNRAVLRLGAPVALVLHCALCLLLSACSDASREVAEPPLEIAPDVLAVVAGTQILASDLEREAERRNARGVDYDKDSLLEELVTRAALVSQARSSGLSEEPEVKREIENLLISKLRERQLREQLDALVVSDETLKARYEDRKAMYTRPAKVRLAVLMLEGGKRMSDTKKSQLTSRMEEARAKALTVGSESGGRNPMSLGFGSIAPSYSDDVASRHRGGDIGWLSEGQSLSHWPAAVLDAGFELEKGAVSELLWEDGNVYLVKKTDVREAKSTPFSTVKASLRRTAMRELREKTIQDFYEKTVQEVGSTTYPDHLVAVKLEPSAVGGNAPTNLPAMP